MPAPYGIPSLFTESVSAVTASNTVELGTLRFDGGEVYQYAYNGGNSQISVGQGCVMTNVSGYTVTVSSVVGLNECYGVVKHATLTTATYGWVLRSGRSNLKASNSLTSGLPYVLGTDGNFLAKSTSTGFTGAVVGQIQQGDTATGGTAFGSVRCL